MNMNLFTYIAMYGILAYSIYIFGKYPIVTSCVIVIVTGWLVLPQAHFETPHIPYHTKIQAISLALLLGVWKRDPNFFGKFRLKWVDIPMLMWSIAPFFTSVTNDLGAYDGAQAVEFRMVDYGIPYVIGRVYFNTFESLKELALGTFVGTLLLLPFVLIELRMSPQMHTWVYGWYPHDFLQTMRSGGFRPSVFMSHGLELAIWNALGAFVGWQLYLRKTILQKVPFLKIPALPSVILLTLVLAVCHSSGAFYLLIIALAVAEISIRLKTIAPILFLALMPIAYISTRSTGAWDAQVLIDASEKISGSAERADSLSFRIKNETILSAKARQRFLFGWGGFGRSFVTDENGNPISVPDGQWIIVLGGNGIIALLGINALYLMPALLFFLKLPIQRIGGAREAPVVAFCIFFIITAIDDLFNAMNNPILIVASGGVLSLILSPAAMSEARDDAPLTPQALPPATMRVI